jgi:hypothetical protein
MGYFGDLALYTLDFRASPPQLRYHHLRWPTAAAQSRRSARAEPVSPNLQILPANLQLSRKGEGLGGSPQ